MAALGLAASGVGTQRFVETWIEDWNSPGPPSGAGPRICREQRYHFSQSMSSCKALTTDVSTHPLPRCTDHGPSGPDSPEEPHRANKTAGSSRRVTPLAPSQKAVILSKSRG